MIVDCVYRTRMNGIREDRTDLPSQVWALIRVLLTSEVFHECQSESGRGPRMHN